ncbi:condensation domain-containing protein [Streptomyces sp. NBC_00237]|uniref:condensation domain-containing protein n=1 Tax=Streptomyces sp. NBC_00237 TaxID=2975687 RepID=UPI00225307D5|nr:condensation domain-containing protein [Streptomyces sp. NBC_00237]MCX5206393.1 condensation domain-containing protein [Streptomyces sp. NBC_00237]
MSLDTPAALQEELLRRARARTSTRSTAPTAAPTAAAPRATAPLSHAQRRMWLMDRLGQRDGVYSVPFATRLTGPLDLDALGEALTALVARHEILRTRYGQRDDVPYQEALPAPGSVPVRVVDTGDAGDDDWADVLSAEARLPFDLAAGAPPRALVLRHGPEDHTVLLTFHHIALDGHSLVTVADEIGRLYGQATSGTPAALPPSPPQYADFARREHATVGGAPDGTATGATAGTADGFGPSLDHWSRRLAGAVPPALPRPAAPPADLAERPAATRVEPLGHAVPDALRAIGAKHRATLFTVQLAAAFAALHRLTDLDDLVIGCAAGHREGREMAGLVGLCVNTLPVRVDLGGDPEFGELVERVRDALLEAQQHRQVPYDLVMERLGAAARGADGTALVRVTADVLGEPTALRLPGLNAEAVDVTLPDAKFDLSFGLFDTAEPAGLVQYARAALDDQAGVALGRSFAALLTAVAADASLRISALPGAAAPAAGSAPHPAEAALRAHPRVADAAVLTTPGGPLLAYAVLRDRIGPSPTQLRSALRGSLPREQVPVAVTLLDALPRTPDGSPDASALPGSPGPARAAAPGGPHAAAVAEAFAHVLRRRPAPDDDFFALGGHSLAAVQLAERLRTGLVLPLTGLDVMECRTPRALTALLDTRAETRDAAQSAAATASAARSASVRSTGRRTVRPGTVLVTGGTGGVGAFVLRELAARGRPVLALARPESAHLVAGDGVEVVEGDLADLDGLRDAVAGADAVIHAACTFTRPEVDVAAMRAMADAWSRGPFVFVSSVDAYGRPATDKVAEEAPPGLPLSPYGQGKADCENILLGAAGTGGRGGASVVRSPLVWGAHDRLRDQLRWGATGLLYQAARADALITLPAPGTEGHAWYGAAWVHASALARAVTACLDAPVHGVANAVSGHVGWPELTDALRDLLGSSSPVRQAAEVHPDLDHRWHYAADRLADALRPEPGEDFRTVLAEMVR